MKIRSLLLGSIAAAGLATTGYAADLGVVTSLDICDELGLSGLTISSDTNCLQITGNISFEYDIGDYNDTDNADWIEGVGTVPNTTVFPAVPATFASPDVAANEGLPTFFYDRSKTPVAAPGARGRNVQSAINNDGTTDTTLDIDAWLQFVATSESDFGNATATIKLQTLNYGGPGATDPAVTLDQAWVGIGDTTMLMAGRKDSIFADKDDMDLGYLQLFNSANVDDGVGFSGSAPLTAGNVVQLVSVLGNGVKIGGGIENLGSSGAYTGVGTLWYDGDGVKAHVSGAIDQAGSWKTHAAFTGTWDTITAVGAFAANSDTVSGYAGGVWWDALGSVSATFDMFKIALSGEATAGNEYGASASLTATVTDGVALNLGGRYFTDAGNGSTESQIEAGVAADVTETIKLTAAIGTYASVVNGNHAYDASYYYGKAGLAWAPSTEFSAGVSGEVNSLGGYKGAITASKSFQ